jgi:hypothetical protein
MRLTVFSILTAAFAAGCHGDADHAHGTRAEPMTEVALAMPIAAGKTDAWRDALHDLTGPRYDEYESSRRRFGLTSQVTFLQRTPMGDFAVIHMTGPDVHRSFHAMSESQDEWDVRWRELTKDLHGVDFATGERVYPKVVPLLATGAADADGRPFLFLAPLGGDTDALRALAAELRGPRAAEYRASRERLGVQREEVYLEHTAMGDAAVFYWRAADPLASLAALEASSDPFDRWLRPVLPIIQRNELAGEYPH